MSKGDLLEFEGEIVEASGGGQYLVRLSENKSIVRAKVGGRLKFNHIRVIPGDRVRVGLSPYDMSHGIIQRRER